MRTGVRRSSPAGIRRPEETVRAARAAVPGNTRHPRCVTHLDLFTRIKRLPRSFRDSGRAVEASWRLALITVLQFMEELPGRQAADAVRGEHPLEIAVGTGVG